MGPVILDGFQAELEVTARYVMEWMLGSPSRVKRSFARVPWFPFDASLAYLLTMRNEQFEVGLIMRMDEAGLPALWSSKSEPGIRLDGFGEIANTIAGNFFGKEHFISTFGQMRGGLPTRVKGNILIPENPCIGGVVEVNSVEVFIGVTVAQGNALSDTARAQ